MKILMVVGGFFPARNYGGPPVSIDNLCTALGERAECFVLSGDTELGERRRLAGICEGWNARANGHVLYLRPGDRTLATLKRVIGELAPDLVYLNSFFLARFALPLVSLSRTEGLPLLIAPRGQLCANALAFKSLKKRPYVFGMRAWLKGANAFFQSTSDEETAQLKQLLDVPAERIFELSNVPTLPSSLPTRPPKKVGTLRCAFLSRIHPKKNLEGALEALREVRGKVAFDIYGPREDAAYWARCEARVGALPPNVIARFRGQVAHEDIHATLGTYDAFLFPTLSENYGHVIAEALLSKCPVIISDQTPWTDVNEAGAGWALPLSEPDGFTRAIQQLVDMDADQHQALVRRGEAYVQRKLRIPETIDAYLACFEAVARSTGRANA